MSHKINGDDYESIDILLTESKYPIAYKAKVEELVEEGMSEKEAKDFLKSPIELELYYEKKQGLFGVETDAAECEQFYSPYTREHYTFSGIDLKKKNDELIKLICSIYSPNLDGLISFKIPIILSDTLNITGIFPNYNGKVCFAVHKSENSSLGTIGTDMLSEKANLMVNRELIKFFKP